MKLRQCISPNPIRDGVHLEGSYKLPSILVLDSHLHNVGRILERRLGMMAVVELANRLGYKLVTFRIFLLGQHLQRRQVVSDGMFVSVRSGVRAIGPAEEPFDALGHLRILPEGLAAIDHRSGPGPTAGRCGRVVCGRATTSSLTKVFVGELTTTTGTRRGRRSRAGCCPYRRGRGCRGR